LTALDDINLLLNGGIASPDPVIIAAIQSLINSSADLQYVVNHSGCMRYKQLKCTIVLNEHL
jgi:hypothetical protein